MERDSRFFDINSLHYKSERPVLGHILSRIEASEELMQNKNIRIIVEDIRKNAKFFCHNLDHVVEDSGLVLPKDIKLTILSIRKRLHDFLDFRSTLREYDLLKPYENLKKIPDLQQKVDELKILIDAVGKGNPLERNKFFLAELADSYFELDDPEKALELFLEIFEKDPQDIYNLFSIAKLYKQQKRKELALSYFRLILEQKPLDLSALRESANLYLENKDYVNANLYFTKILMIDSGQHDIQDKWKEIQSFLPLKSNPKNDQLEDRDNIRIIQELLKNSEKTKAVFHLLKIKNTIPEIEWDNLFKLIFTKEECHDYPEETIYQRFIKKMGFQQSEEIPYELGFFVFMYIFNQYSPKQGTKKYTNLGCQYIYDRDRQLFYANYDLCLNQYNKSEIFKEYDLTKPNADRILMKMRTFCKNKLTEYPNLFNAIQELPLRKKRETPSSDEQVPWEEMIRETIETNNPEDTIELLIKAKANLETQIWEKLVSAFNQKKEIILPENFEFQKLLIDLEVETNPDFPVQFNLSVILLELNLCNLFKNEAERTEKINFYQFYYGFKENNNLIKISLSKSARTKINLWLRTKLLQKYPKIFYDIDVDNTEEEKVFSLEEIDYPGDLIYSTMLKKLWLRQNNTIPKEIGFQIIKRKIDIIFPNVEHFQTDTSRRRYDKLNCLRNRNILMLQVELGLCQEYTESDIFDLKELSTVSYASILKESKNKLRKYLCKEYPELFKFNTNHTPFHESKFFSPQLEREIKLIYSNYQSDIKPHSLEAEIQISNSEVRVETEKELLESLSQELNQVVEEDLSISEELAREGYELADKIHGVIDKLAKRVDFYSQEAQKSKDLMQKSIAEKKAAQIKLIEAEGEKIRLTQKVQDLETEIKQLRAQFSSPQFQLLQLMSDPNRIAKLLELEKSNSKKESDTKE